MRSLQIQTVLFKNEKQAIYNSLDAICNALKQDAASSEPNISDVTLLYGDASPEPLFSDEEIARMAESCKGVLTLKYDYFNENTGTAKGHNRMGAQCTSEFLMIMNPDIILAPSYFTAMFTPYNTQENVGLVEARQVPIEHPKEYDFKTGDTPWASTAAVVFPYSVFQEVNGFDAETFFMYCDDVDFSWRIRLAGYRVIYQPRAMVFHAKRLNRDGSWMPTNAEIYYSAEAALLMSYKYSNQARVDELLKYFEGDKNEAHARAAAAYRERVKNGNLPEQIDAEHKVGQFTTLGGYAELRY